MGRLAEDRMLYKDVAGLCCVVSSFSHSLSPPPLPASPATLDRTETRIEGRDELGKSLNLISFRLFLL